MLNINELEQRWRRYKIKSYIPHAVILISLLSISSIAFVLLNKKEVQVLNNTNIVENVLKKEIKTIQTEAEEKTTLQIAQEIIQPTNSSPTQKIVTVNEETHTKMTISPSLDFMKKMQDNTLSNYENHISPNANNQYRISTKPKPVKKQKKPKEKEKIIVEEKPLEIAEVKSTVRIKRQNTHDDISQVVSRFNKNNNPALSLFIAKKYYELGDYHKSYNYALITNEINSEIEASWIVFAKSLVKLQEKKQAIKILQKYINHSHSNRANILLDDIVSGKFK